MFFKRKIDLNNPTNEVLFFQNENAKLQDKNIDLKNKVALLFNKNSQFKKENETIKNENASLKEQLDWLKKQIFGKKSEKTVEDLNADQLVFEGFEQSPEEEKTKKIAAHTRRVSKKDKDTIKIPSDLSVEEIFIDIPEKDKICPLTGKPLIKIGEEVSLKLAYIPGKYYIKKIIVSAI